MCVRIAHWNYWSVGLSFWHPIFFSFFSLLRERERDRASSTEHRNHYIGSWSNLKKEATFSSKNEWKSLQSRWENADAFVQLAMCPIVLYSFTEHCSFFILLLLLLLLCLVSASARLPLAVRYGTAQHSTEPAPTSKKDLPTDVQYTQFSVWLSSPHYNMENDKEEILGTPKKRRRRHLFFFLLLLLIFNISNTQLCTVYLAFKDLILYCSRVASVCDGLPIRSVCMTWLVKSRSAARRFRPVFNWKTEYSRAPFSFFLFSFSSFKDFFIVFRLWPVEWTMEEDFLIPVVVWMEDK